MTLIDLYVDKGRVQILGWADPTAAGGKRVTVTSLFDGTAAATATVQSDGYFRTTAKLPPKPIRATNKARYRATVGTARSPALKLTRRLVVLRIDTLSGNKVRISGRVAGPFARPRARLAVTRRDSCRTAFKKLASSKTSYAASGRFSLVVPAGPAGSVYRVKTRVRRSARDRTTVPTASLPRVADK